MNGFQLIEKYLEICERPELYSQNLRNQQSKYYQETPMRREFKSCRHSCPLCGNLALPLLQFCQHHIPASILPTDVQMPNVSCPQAPQDSEAKAVQQSSPIAFPLESIDNQLKGEFCTVKVQKIQISDAEQLLGAWMKDLLVKINYD